MKGYVSLFNDNIRIASLEPNGDLIKDKPFGFSLDNGLYDYDQFNLIWFCICWLRKC